MCELAEAYPDRGMMSFTVAPSTKVSDWPLQDYNEVLAFH